MNFQQCDVDGFRIYAGALDTPHGGYIAAVEVHRVNPPRSAPSMADHAERIFSNDLLSGGHRFAEPELALRHALQIGRQVVRLADAAAD
ncbi:hypothetical protein [Rivibacter subsaxonicus]|uniref:Uncharacterized protein n=1 Tax=Rivibacter subsaxonicus TaxID=457575 RepID=A0A4Q7VWH9_9BURK|nr:hypothetical protein [Rivibacter subsaxonicus]RZU01020.1 hypothetical protein EV670_1733 [Rivibacter subsaxonicus]